MTKKRERYNIGIVFWKKNEYEEKMEIQYWNYSVIKK